MHDEEILFGVNEGVARITLNRPEKLNALTPAMLTALPRLIADAAAEGARAILLTGAGRGFCSGAALSSEGLGERDLGKLVAEYYNPIARAIADSAIPIVTAVNGVAAGAGVGIALGGDVIVAARSAYFQFAFAKIGLVPDCGSTWLTARAIGRVRTLELALLAERLTADDARAAGLITRVADDEGFVEEAEALARRVAAGPTLTLGLIRRQVRLALDEDLEASLEVEMTNQRTASRTADYGEGVAAFMEKRIASFEGR